MSPLNIHPEENVTSSKKKNNKMLKVMLGIGALVLVPVIGTTLASQIAVGTDGVDVVFGQGEKAALACDPDVLMTATAQYKYGFYRLKSITVSSVDLTACADKRIEVSTAYSAATDYDELGMIDTFYTSGEIIRASTIVNATTDCSATYFTCTYNASSPATITFTVKDTAYGVGSLDIGKLLIQQTE